MSITFNHTNVEISTTNTSTPLTFNNTSGLRLPLTSTEIHNTNGSISLCTTPSAPGLNDDNRIMYYNNSYRRVAVNTDINDITNLSDANISNRFDSITDRIDQLYNRPDTPTGLIAIWYQTTIPKGWIVCNGSSRNGFTTPDMRDRFVVSAKNPSSTNGRNKGASGWGNLSTNDYGGESSHILTEAELPAHKHVTPWGEHRQQGGSWGYWNNTGLNNSGTTNYGGNGGSDHDNYWIKSSPSGSNKGHNNMPPLYSLVFIMFVGQ